ncbi:MAG: hypothetical protein JSV63_03350 [Candidatus Aenigmatarchaeota archaeon]|nr:MAG: hypothetical protein JSV63_03350 [Candidatus Aenigmarchaeota archaeon]
MTAKEDLKKQRISVTIHAVAALIIGMISPFIGRPLYALGAALLVGVIVGHVTQRIVGKQKFSWWLGNGLIIYLLLWFDVWIFNVNHF